VFGRPIAPNRARHRIRASSAHPAASSVRAASSTLCPRDRFRIRNEKPSRLSRGVQRLQPSGVTSLPTPSPGRTAIRYVFIVVRSSQKVRFIRPGSPGPRSLEDQTARSVLGQPPADRAVQILALTKAQHSIQTVDPRRQPARRVEGTDSETAWRAIRQLGSLHVLSGRRVSQHTSRAGVHLNPGRPAATGRSPRLLAWSGWDRRCRVNQSGSSELSGGLNAPHGCAH